MEGCDGGRVLSSGLVLMVLLGFVCVVRAKEFFVVVVVIVIVRVRVVGWWVFGWREKKKKEEGVQGASSRDDRGEKKIAMTRSHGRIILSKDVFSTCFRSSSDLWISCKHHASYPKHHHPSRDQ